MTKLVQSLFLLLIASLIVVSGWAQAQEPGYDFEARYQKLSRVCSASMILSKELNHLSAAQATSPYYRGFFAKNVYTPIQTGLSLMANLMVDTQLGLNEVQSFYEKIGTPRLERLIQMTQAAQKTIRQARVHDYVKDPALKNKVTLEDILEEINYRSLCVAKCIAANAIDDLDLGDQDVATYLKSYSSMAENNPAVSLAVGSGVCRHHSDIFVALSKSIGFWAEKVNQVDHEFVQVNFQGKKIVIDPSGEDCYFFSTR